MRSKNAFVFREIEMERVRTDAACFQKFTHIFDQLDLAKFSLIIERQPPVVREMKKDSRGFWRFFVAFEVLKVTGHAEMQSQPELIASAHEQMLAMPMTVFEAMPFQSTCHLASGNILQNISISHFDIGDPLVQ